MSGNKSRGTVSRAEEKKVQLGAPHVRSSKGACALQGSCYKPWEAESSCMNFSMPAFFLKILPLGFLNLPFSSICLPLCKDTYHYDGPRQWCWVSPVSTFFMQTWRPLQHDFCLKESWYGPQECSPINSHTPFLDRSCDMMASSSLSHPFLGGSNSSGLLYSLCITTHPVLWTSESAWLSGTSLKCLHH